MNSTRALARSLAISVTLVLMGIGVAASADEWATVAPTFSNVLPVRRGPGTEYRTVYTLARGSQIRVSCWVPGLDPSDRSETRWYKLVGQNEYVHARGVTYTPTNGIIPVPRCGF